MPGLTVETAKIANGQSLSGAVRTNGYRLVGIQMPDGANWTAAVLTFQASYDGNTYEDVYDAGTELNVPAAENRYILLPETPFLLAPFIKIRSGTSGAAVAQGAERVLNLVFALL